MTSVTILYDRVRWEEKALASSAREKGYGVKTLDAKTLLLDSSLGSREVRKTFSDIALQRCMSHSRGLCLTAYLESKDVEVVNSHKVSEICGNKLLTTLALVKAGVPTPRTLFSFSKESAFRGLDILGYPAVLKPLVGSWGRMVASIRDRESAEAILELREQLSNPLDQIQYIQEFVKRPPRDLRTIVVGGEIVTGYYRVAADGEWRTNVARGGRPEPCNLSPENEEIVLKAAKAVGGGVLGVDSMEGPEGLVVHEVNSTVEFRGAASVSSADIPSRIIDYTVSHSRR